MTGYPKDAALDLLADLRRVSRTAFADDKLTTVLRMINDLEITMLATAVGPMIGSVSSVKTASGLPEFNQKTKVGRLFSSRPPVGEYRREDEAIPLPSPAYEEGN